MNRKSFSFGSGLNGCFRSSSEISGAFCRSAKESFAYLVKYLATFAGEDAATLSEAKDDAVRAVIEFVRAPDSFQVLLLCHLAFERKRLLCFLNYAKSCGAEVTLFSCDFSQVFDSLLEGILRDFVIS